MNKQALLIGINQYQVLPELKYARQDAKAIADSLQRNYSFSDNEVMLLTDDRPGLFKPTNRYIIQEHLEKLANQELDLRERRHSALNSRLRTSLSSPA